MITNAFDTAAGMGFNAETAAGFTIIVVKIRNLFNEFMAWVHRFPRLEVGP